MKHKKKQRQLFEKFLWDIYSVSNIPLQRDIRRILCGYITLSDESSGHAFNEHGDLIPLPMPKKVNSLIPFLDPRICITLFSDQDQYYKMNKLSLVDLKLKFETQTAIFFLS